MLVEYVAGISLIRTVSTGKDANEYGVELLYGNLVAHRIAYDAPISPPESSWRLERSPIDPRATWRVRFLFQYWNYKAERYVAYARKSILVREWAAGIPVW